MSVAYNKICQEVANLLGAVVGSDAATAEANYGASISTSTVVGPDFTPAMIQDAVVLAIGEIIAAIADTPRHPERAGFLQLSGNLASGAALPTTIAGSQVMGIVNRVIDAADSRPLLPMDIDKIRAYLRFALSVYAGLDPYWYVIDGNTLLHTRANAKVEMVCWVRPTSFAGNIPLADWHERGIVAGAVAYLADKEGQYAQLGASSRAEYLRHLGEVRALGRPENYGGAQVAPTVMK